MAWLASKLDYFPVKLITKINNNKKVHHVTRSHACDAIFVNKRKYL